MSADVRDVLSPLSSARSLPPEMLNRVRHGDRALVLPHPHYEPSALAQLQVVSAVSPSIAGDLFLPPCCIRLGGDSVLTTPVPEAPVDLHSNARTTQYDVRTAGKTWDVDPKSHSSTVKLTAKSEFGLSTGGRQAGHELRNCRT